MADTNFIAPPGRQEVLITRTINAPREIVFRTVTDPLLLPDWWGPRDVTTVVHKMIVMPGGSYRYLQHDKEGREYGFHGIYHDVVIPERLVYTMEYEGTPGHVSIYIDSFEDHGAKTIINSKTIFQSVEDRDLMLQYEMERGTVETTNRLNELLDARINLNREEIKMTHHESHTGNGKHIKITREFDAPIEQVWERWTDPKKYMCWGSPKDFTTPYSKIDLRPGGKYLNSMRDSEGREYWSTGTYKEIIEPNRIVCTDSMADEHGNIVPATYYGMGSDIPMEMELEVNFEEVDGKTRLVLEHCGLPEGEDLENATLGWNQMLDKLEECLC